MSSYRIKPLRELTIKDNFMFGAVMCDEENCRQLLEMILQIPILKVEVSREKSIVYHPEYKGVRLDVYARDEHQTHYNVEMQTIREDALGKRSRYYHSQLDMELLERGARYAELPHTYVIFICDFDPFGAGKYCYTYESICRESPDSELLEERTSIFLSTKGKNEAEVPEEMVRFLRFVSAGPEESMQDFGDGFVRRLQAAVQSVKISREMEGRYMGFQEMLERQYNAGKTEGIAQGISQGITQGRSDERAAIIVLLLESKGAVSEELQSKIRSEKDLDVLARWLQTAMKVPSGEEFTEAM